MDITEPATAAVSQDAVMRVVDLRDAALKDVALLDMVRLGIASHPAARPEVRAVGPMAEVGAGAAKS